MRNLKIKARQVLLTVFVFTAFITSGTIYSDDQLPAGVEQVWTAVEGNITYYVKPGDKVKKGDPLFLVMTADINPAVFFQTLHKIEYYKILFQRREGLLNSRAVSKEEFDNALNDLVFSKDELISYLFKLKEGFYMAPYDCEIVKLLYINGSGIGDGNPAINIRCTDKNYKFEPPKPNQKLLELIKLSDETLNIQTEQLDVKDVMDFLRTENI